MNDDRRSTIDDDDDDEDGDDDGDGDGGDDCDAAMAALRRHIARLADSSFDVPLPALVVELRDWDRVGFGDALGEVGLGAAGRGERLPLACGLLRVWENG